MTDKPATLASALAAFQAELPKVRKDQTADAGTYKYKYADLASISSVVLPALAKHGLSFSATPTLDDGGRLVLDYVLRHAGSDERIGGVYPLGSGTPQQIGSAITYARRYALCAITGVAADEDDDGRTAGEAPLQRPEEPFWEPTEQAMLYDGWHADIAKASDDAELQDIADKIKAAKGKTLSPVKAAKLRVDWAARKAELDKAKQDVSVEVATS